MKIKIEEKFFSGKGRKILMKKNYLILALLLCIALLITACGGSSNQGQAEKSVDPKEKVETE